MDLFFEDPWKNFFLFLTSLIVIIVSFFHNSYRYWSRKGIPTIKTKFPLGNANSLLPRGFSVGTHSKTFYDEFKQRGHKFGGIYLVTTPNLVVVDPEYIKDILCTDFHHFVDRGFYYNKKDDPLSANLFAIDGLDWKSLRIKVTPTFTSGKMKMMFKSVVECSNQMQKFIDETLTEDIDAKEVLSRFTTDVIGSCAFGIQCNSFKYPDAEFRTMGKKHFSYSFFRSLTAFFAMCLPKLARKLRLCVIRSDVQRFFRKVVADTVRMREENKIRRNDFIQILTDLRQSSNMTLDEIAAQVFLFFLAGFDTSSTTMTFGLYELARNPNIQEKVREEINQVLKKHNEITYESLKEMKYLDQVLDETLRMYPPLSTINRRCTKEYTLRNTDIVIEEGTPVLISTLGLHMDPEFYPEPEKFDPERFNDETKKGRNPFVYLPFGDGPRNCIGLRFGIMQSKIGMVTWVKNFRLSVSSSTKAVELDSYRFLLSSKDKIYLKVERL